MFESEWFTILALQDQDFFLSRLQRVILEDMFMIR